MTSGLFETYSEALTNLTNSKSTASQMQIAANKVVECICNEMQVLMAVAAALSGGSLDPSKEACYGLDRVLMEWAVFDNLQGALAFEGSPQARQGALIGISTLVKKFQKPIEPIVLPLLPMILERLADRTPAVSRAAMNTAKEILALPSTYAFAFIIPTLFEIMEKARKWQTVKGTLEIIESLIPKIQPQLLRMFPTLVPVLSNYMVDVTPAVCDAAASAMNKLCSIIGNPDIENILPAVVKCISDPSSLNKAVELLSQTTFVKAVHQPELAIMVPLLVRTLKESSPLTIRKASVIIDNMCRVVESPMDIHGFLPLLLEGLHRVVDVAADPEIRAVAAKAIMTLHRVGGLAVPEHLVEVANYERSAMITNVTHIVTQRDLDKLAKQLEETKLKKEAIQKVSKTTDEELDDIAKELAAAAEKAVFKVTVKQVADLLVDIVKTTSSLDVKSQQSAQEHPWAYTVIEHIARVCHYLMHIDELESDEWENEYVTPYLATFVQTSYRKEIQDTFFNKCVDMADNADGTAEEIADGDDVLCNCKFSLAYGGMVLLRKAHLVLRRGARYGICGHNGCGKSTLFRSIASGHLEGFPSADQVKTVMVAHDLQASDAGTAIVDFLANDSRLADVDRQTIVDALLEFGFSQSMQQQQVGSLSGGWKMKLALARAILMKADILLLDEPTNHLDRGNVNWLQDYLLSQKSVTSLIISHDSGFLDTVCDHIIHYERRKLKTYKGNLTDFVQVKPEAKSYFTLEAPVMKFNFPKPGMLDGVTSKNKSVLKVTNAHFQYPTRDRKALDNVSASVCLNSRVAVIGANGAGKSTLIKILTGELVPQEGTVWKHPALRVTYVAQHPLEYLNMHLDKSPNEYLQWRFETGEDKEITMKQSRKTTKEEEEQMAKYITGSNGEQRRVAALVGRAKHKKSYQYEVAWVGLGPKHNTWMPRDRLEELGFQKLLQAFDDKEAGREGLSGLMSRNLTTNSIEEYFQDFGLEPQFSTYGKIQGLSGGQKIKTILACAMWAHPHLIILDEPTNYLDRDSLAALADAIRRFEGGVVIISHNEEFTSALCTERWYMKEGILTMEGKSSVDEAENDDSTAVEAEDSDVGSVPLSKTASVASSVSFDAPKTRREKSSRSNASANSGQDDESTAPASKGKKLTRKQKKDLEYQAERSRLAQLGIIPQ